MSRLTDSKWWAWTPARLTAVVLSTVALAACGGGGGGSAEACVACATPAVNANAGSTAQAGGATSPQALPPSPSARPTRQEATRFLTQATFGPTQSEVQRLMAVGYQAWLAEQFAMPMSGTSHTAAWDASNKAIMAINADQRASSGELSGSFWRQAVTSPDQLRQRLAFALSEIFVVSTADSCGGNGYSRGAAGYLDMLGRQAFGSYRELLRSVALHPVMGCYLTYFQNQKEDAATGRLPDENFAREVMQLFSIGLVQLKQDGSPQLDANQSPMEAYTASDVSGLAKVFTGWSLSCTEGLTAGCFFSNPSWPEQFVSDMRGFASYHSTTEKRFLGAVVPASSQASPEAGLNVALDTLAVHPNVGPFIGKQLIQRLVTSNPSPAYVARVASAFRDSGGSLRAMVSAILLDAEARDMAATRSPTFGKVREPILRFSALLRAFDAKSDSGMFLITTTSDPGTSLGQSALAAPSVFNFFRPGYIKPGSLSAGAQLVTPEMQIATETSAAGYVNFMTRFIWSGEGRHGLNNQAARADVQLDYNVNPGSPWLAMADQPATLVEELNQRLMYGTMPAGLKTEIVQAIGALDFRAPLAPTEAQIRDTRQKRLWSAVLLTVASPDYQVQK